MTDLVDMQEMDAWVGSLRMKLHLQVSHYFGEIRGQKRYWELQVHYSGAAPKVPRQFLQFVVERHHYTPRRAGKLLAPFGSFVLKWSTEK